MSSVPTNGRFGKPFSIYDGLVCNLWSQPPLGKGLQVFARQSMRLRKFNEYWSLRTWGIVSRECSSSQRICLLYSLP